MRRASIILFTLAVLGFETGCRNCCKRLSQCRLFHHESSTRIEAPAPLGPTSPLIAPPPGGVPVTPSEGLGLPSPKASDLPPPSIPETRNYLPSPQASDLPPPSIPETKNYTPEPKKGGRELVLPDPLPGNSKSRHWLEDPAEIKPNTNTANALPKNTYPGLKDFTVVISGIATGRKPGLDGFDALKSSNYKTVVYLHSPQTDVSAVKAVAEKRGLTFVAIPVSADNVKAAFEQFEKQLADSASKPMYINDDDGVRTGVLWYAHFRRTDGLADDAAQVRAAPLGLRDSTGEEKARLLAAVQDFLANR